MGKTGVGSSWLTAVKRAFRSPAKENSATDNNSTDTRSSTGPRHHHHTQQHGQIKKKERKGWLFRKPTNHEATHQTLTKNVANDNDNVSEAEQRHAIAVAVATAKAAEAAVATAQAAMEVARLAAPSSSSSSYAREHYAATVVQTAFRGYLARRALRALKGVVKLQALIRGHNARSQAKMTLRCMQALVLVQAQVLDQRVRRSNDSSNRKSTFSDTNRIWDSHHLQDASDRKSMSRNGSSIADEWDERMHTLEEVKALKRERNLSQAFSQQMWRNNRNKSFGNEEDLGPRQDRWTKRSSTDRRNDSFFKTVEIDNTSHYLLRHQNSPRHRHLPATPLHSRPIPAQARSASPCYNRPQSPSLKSNYFYNGPMALNGPIVPNYMAETESARARVRAQSAPRQRPATPERERGERMVAKKRLSYNNVKDHARVEQQSNYSSCYSDSIGGEISPSSTTDLRKWLR